VFRAVLTLHNIDMKLWTYRHSFAVERISGKVQTVAALSAITTTLLIDGVEVGIDRFETRSAPVLRNNLVKHVLSDGRLLEVECGYLNWWNMGIRVRIDGQLVHESHPGKALGWPQSVQRMQANKVGIDPSVAQAQNAQMKRNMPSICVDIGIGILFFVVAKFSNLVTASLVSAGAGILIFVIQRFVKVDLLGGLATFGILMSLIAAGFSYAFQDDWMVKMRSTILGVLTAAIFLSDGLLGGRYLGKRMVRYFPYPDISPARLTIGIGLVGLFMAFVNYAIATHFSTDVWLVYSTFGDIAISFALTLGVIRWSRTSDVIRQ
jgi:intracellular septation protein A